MIFIKILNNTQNFFTSRSKFKLKYNFTACFVVFSHFKRTNFLLLQIFMKSNFNFSSLSKLIKRQLLIQFSSGCFSVRFFLLSYFYEFLSYLVSKFDYNRHTILYKYPFNLVSTIQVDFPRIFIRTISLKKTSCVN